MSTLRRYDVNYLDKSKLHILLELLSKTTLQQSLKEVVIDSLYDPEYLQNDFDKFNFDVKIISSLYFSKLMGFIRIIYNLKRLDTICTFRS